MEKMICRQGMADTPKAWIYYKESGHGVPILMLHGNAETHMIFDFYEKKLSANYRVILMDSRAHGRSRIKPDNADAEFTTADMAKDAAALLDVLRIPSCILFGFSDGANIALEFASLFPERTLSVIAVSGNITPDGLIFPVRMFCIGKYYFIGSCPRFSAHVFFHRNVRAVWTHQLPIRRKKGMHLLTWSILMFSAASSSPPCSATRR